MNKISSVTVRDSLTKETFLKYSTTEFGAGRDETHKRLADQRPAITTDVSSEVPLRVYMTIRHHPSTKA